MTFKKLAEAWTDHTDTPNISDTELARIASRAACVGQAYAIWDNENWWHDPD